MSDASHFRNILVYVDLDRQRHCALDKAAELARHHGSALKLVHCVEEPPWWTDRLLGGMLHKWQVKFLEEAGEKLRQLADPLVADGLSVTTAPLSGRPWMETVKEAIRGQHDLVIKDMQLAGEPVYGSDMDLQLVRKCPCPVWLIQPAWQAYHRVLAAVDITPDDPDRDALNRKIVELAADRAAEEQAELHVVRAWTIYGESVLKSHMTADELQQIKDRKQQILHEVVSKLVDPVRDRVPSLHVHLPEGPAEQIIPQMADHTDEDLLVMGTIARTGIAGMILGSTAEQILRRVRCSVLAVKPDGFVSPVRVD